MLSGFSPSHSRSRCVLPVVYARSSLLPIVIQGCDTLGDLVILSVLNKIKTTELQQVRWYIGCARLTKKGKIYRNNHLIFNDNLNLLKVKIFCQPTPFRILTIFFQTVVVIY